MQAPITTEELAAVEAPVDSSRRLHFSPPAAFNQLDGNAEIIPRLAVSLSLQPDSDGGAADSSPGAANRACDPLFLSVCWTTPKSSYIRRGQYLWPSTGWFLSSLEKQ
ncbi:hypothetical protein PVAP13_8NG268901 [Panicum virgatum]|uniref:Uncharacterized protein n=1 Tax=Panicum virgatum TaxID=38727 RepID=A0A8T0PJI1_PANVG|nr:hypothetical protein PVAP13_8NG268901 [Panicum virgatum]